MKALLSALLAILFAVSAAPAKASALEIANRTAQEIINVLVQPQAQPGDFFLRLDLLPGASDSVDNPGGIADMRVDTGFELWQFRDIDFGRATKLIFCGEHSACLVFNAAGETRHLTAKIQRLIPEKGDRPVCNLDRFRPAMTMREVCDILPAEMLKDDNGALLAGIGFAGLAWAARLVPDATAPAGAYSLLDHLSLRRHLDLPDLAKLLEELARRGYVPWQADFPGLEVLPGNEPAAQSVVQIGAFADAFLELANKTGHGPHARGRRCSEASIIMAPASRLAELENSDEPPADIQIYTIYLQPCSNTLLLDIAAYRGSRAR